MKNKLMALLPWLVLLAVVVSYGIAFTLPARTFRQTDGTLGEPMMGWQAFHWALSFNVYVWYANPVFWLGAVLLLLRLWRWAALAGLTALSFSVIFFLRDRFGEHPLIYQSGFWLWTGSQTLLAVSGALGASCSRHPSRRRCATCAPIAALAADELLWRAGSGLCCRASSCASDWTPRRDSGGRRRSRAGTIRKVSRMCPFSWRRCPSPTSRCRSWKRSGAICSRGWPLTPRRTPCCSGSARGPMSR